MELMILNPGTYSLVGNKLTLGADQPEARKIILQNNTQLSDQTYP